MSLGRNIARCRRKKYMTQGELARAAGISKTYLSRIEEGKITHPHIKTLIRIADALNLNIRDLLKKK